MGIVDRLTVQVLIDNVADMLSTRPEHVTSELGVLRQTGIEEITGQGLCRAQHGLSLLITAHVGGEERMVLFDAGPDPATLERNAGLVGANFRKIEALVLSHGHFDHSEGMIEAAHMIGQRLPLHVHPGAFVKRAVRLRDGEMLALQDVPSREALEHAGVRVMECDQAEEILGGAFFLSGEIPRRSFERGLENQLRRSASGEWEPDPWCMEERFLAAHVRGKGLAIFTGCSHAGIINICSHAQELFPNTPLYALIGGLHLVYPNEDLIEESIASLREFGLGMIIPGHCTGYRATNALINSFGEDVVDPLAVGSRYEV